MSSHKKIRKIGLALQGGGSAGAFTAGVLDSLLLDTSIEISHITGTSAGALNGYIIAQAINKYGYTQKGRIIARQRLKEAWELLSSPYKPNPYQNMCLEFMRMANPLFDSAMKHGFSHTLERNLETICHNPNALQQGSPIHLSINAVDENGQHSLFSECELTPRTVLASAALPGFINPVKIGNLYYRDGACAGGSNPPIEPLWNNGQNLDAVICVMTNIPEHPIEEKLQKDLTAQDLKGTNGLILHQSFNEIAYLLNHSNTPMHVIMPPLITPWSKRDKQDISRDRMLLRYGKGKTTMVDFLRAHSSTLHHESSMTVDDLRQIAKGRPLVAA